MVVPAIPKLLETHRSRIQAYIRRMIADAAEAEDLTQETFLRAHARRESLRDPEAAIGWLYRIATRVALDRLRQKASRAPREYGGDFNLIDLADTRTPTLLKVLEQKEMSACVQDYIAKLSDDYRAVILLHDLHGLTAEEIAETLHLSVATVKIRIHRARRKLQTELGEGCALPARRRRQSDLRTQVVAHLVSLSGAVSSLRMEIVLQQGGMYVVPLVTAVGMDIPVVHGADNDRLLRLYGSRSARRKLLLLLRP